MSSSFWAALLLVAFQVYVCVSASFESGQPHLVRRSLLEHASDLEEEGIHCAVYSASMIYCDLENIPSFAKDLPHSYVGRGGLVLEESGVSKPPVMEMAVEEFELPVPNFAGAEEREKFFEHGFVKGLMPIAGESGDKVDIEGVKTLHMKSQQARLHEFPHATLPDKALCETGQASIAEVPGGGQSVPAKVALTRQDGQAGPPKTESLIQLYGVETWSYQHFLEYASSKIAPVLNYVNTHKEMKALVEVRSFSERMSYNNPQVPGMLNLMGITEDRRINHGSQWTQGPSKVTADKGYQLCDAPGIGSPKLAGMFRDAIKVSDASRSAGVSLEEDDEDDEDEGGEGEMKAGPSEKGTVVWISRDPSSNMGVNNMGRHIKNEKEVMEAMGPVVAKHGLDLVVHSGTHNTIEEAIDFFSRARAIVGAHGGGLYNGWIAPDKASVIEIQPSTLDCGSINALWINSALIGQPYYRIHGESEAKEDSNAKFEEEDGDSAFRSDLTVDPAKVSRILEEALSSDNSTPKRTKKHKKTATAKADLAKAKAATPRAKAAAPKTKAATPKAKKAAPVKVAVNRRKFKTSSPPKLATIPRTKPGSKLRRVGSQRLSPPRKGEGKDGLYFHDFHRPAPQDKKPPNYAGSLDGLHYHADEIYNSSPKKLKPRAEKRKTMEKAQKRKTINGELREQAPLDYTPDEIFSANKPDLKQAQKIPRNKIEKKLEMEDPLLSDDDVAEMDVPPLKQDSGIF